MDEPTRSGAERWRRLEELLRPHHERAARTARGLAGSRTEGDDLYQEAVLRAWAKLDSLRDDLRFAGWFYRILVSIHRSRARRSSWRRFLSLEEERERGFDPPGTDGAHGAEERARTARAADALASLPAAQREALVLFELEGFSVLEVAEIQGVSTAAVKSRLGRGRRRVRRHYERIGFAAGGRPAGLVPPARGLAPQRRGLTEGETP